MSKHTPGPWVTSTTSPCHNNIQHEGGFVAFTAIPRRCSDERHAGESWLDMRIRTQPERDAIDEEQVANARLIAAAPELLAALQYIVGCSAPMTPQQEHCWPTMRAAIAKATGEQS